MRYPSMYLRSAYVIVLLSVVLSAGARVPGSLVWLQVGDARAVLPLLGPLLLILLCLYRVFLVIKVPGTLVSLEAKGVGLLLRRVGLLFLYLGAIVVVLSLGLRPLLTGASAGVRAVAFYTAIFGGIGVLGLILFEFNRLLSFEGSFSEHPSGKS